MKIQTMKIQTIENRMPELIGVLTQVWEDSVRATHHFLMPGDVERIKELSLIHI